MTATAPLLEVRDVEVTYLGAIVALHGVTVTVMPGQIAVVLGPNGAGKTTTLKAIAGFSPIDNARITRGSVWFDGRRISGLSSYKVSRLGIAVVPERDKVFRSLTVQENLKCVATRKGESRDDWLSLAYELFPILSTRARQVAGYLSGGQIQMLAIARALVAGPRLLLPDEVSLGLAPVVIEEILDALRRVNSETGVGMLLVEQNATLALGVADTAHVLSTGRLAFSGSPEELRSDVKLASVYIGAH